MPRSIAYDPEDSVEARCLVANRNATIGTNLTSAIDISRFTHGDLIIFRGTGDSDVTWKVQSGEDAAGPFTDLLDRDGSPYQLNFLATDDDVLQRLTIPYMGAGRFLNVNVTVNSGSTGQYNVVLESVRAKRTESVVFVADLDAISLV